MIASKLTSGSMKSVIKLILRPAFFSAHVFVKVKSLLKVF